MRRICDFPALSREGDDACRQERGNTMLSTTSDRTYARPSAPNTTNSPTMRWPSLSCVLLKPCERDFAQSVVRPVRDGKQSARPPAMNMLRRMSPPEQRIRRKTLPVPEASSRGLTEDIADQLTTARRDGFVKEQPNLPQELLGPDVQLAERLKPRITSHRA